MAWTLRETPTQRLARLLEAWRYDRTRLTADDIGWLLERGQIAQESGQSVCQECARPLDDPERERCWQCIRDAEFLEGGTELRVVGMDWRAVSKSAGARLREPTEVAPRGVGNGR